MPYVRMASASRVSLPDALQLEVWYVYWKSLC